MRSRPLRFIVWLLAVAVSAAGIYVSYDLTAEHLRIPRQQDSLLEDACTGFATSSCAKVSRSEWGEIGWGEGEQRKALPTAEFGLFFFTFVLSWFLLVGGCSPRRWWAHLILAIIVALGLGASLFLEWVMWSELYKKQGFWCPLCLTAHVANLLLLVFVLVLWPRPTRPAPAVAPLGPDQPEGESQPMFAPAAEAPPADRPWPHWWVLAITPLVAILATGAMHFQLLWRASSLRYEVADEQKGRYEALYYYEKSKDMGDLVSYMLTPQIEIPIDGEPVRGPANAKHTIVIFSDFDCPACGRFEEWFEKYIGPAIHDPGVGGVKIIFKHWPISTDCNRLAVYNSHPLACRAAQAAEAARIVGGDDAFWKMHDLLFKRRDEWRESKSFVGLARELGLDEDAFLAAMDSPEAVGRIKRHIEEGERLGMELVDKGKIEEPMRYWIKVHGTPSIFVNNKRMYTRGKTNTWYRILGYTPPRKPATRPAGQPAHSAQKPGEQADESVP